MYVEGESHSDFKYHKKSYKDKKEAHRIGGSRGRTGRCVSLNWKWSYDSEPKHSQDVGNSRDSCSETCLLWADWFLG